MTQDWCLQTSILEQWQEQLATGESANLHGSYAALIVGELLKTRQERDTLQAEREALRLRFAELEKDLRYFKRLAGAFQENPF